MDNNKDRLSEAIKSFINLPAPKTKYREPGKKDLETQYKYTVDKNGKPYLREMPLKMDKK